MNNYELQHYGVKGMKWGVRKRYITAAQGQRNASRAANEARKNSIAESRASGDKGMGSFARANRKALNAKRQAYSQSIANDKAYNRQLRAEKKAAAITSEAKAQQGRDQFRERRRHVSKSRSMGAKIVTNLWAGPFANRTYNSVIASGGSRVKAFGVTTAAALVAPPIGHLAVSALYTNDAGLKNLD